MVKNHKSVSEAPKRIGLTDAKERLLAAASELLCEHDEIASIRDVADRAGLNLSLIKYYFGSKDRMLIEVAMRDLSPAIAELRINANLAIPAAERLRGHILGTVNTLHRYPYLNQLVLTMLHDLNPRQSRQVSDDFVQPLYEMIRHILADGVAAQEFRSVDPVFAYFTITGACVQIFSSRTALGYIFGLEEIDIAVRDSFAEHTISMLLQGLSR